jgi:hypothetical protein
MEKMEALYPANPDWRPHARRAATDDGEDGETEACAKYAKMMARWHLETLFVKFDP